MSYFQKRGKKRGLSQVDWAISLGIFLLFLAWFFVFIAPSMSPSKNTESLSYIVESKLKSYYWNVYRAPLFIELNRSLGYNEYQPFIGGLYLDDSYNYSIDSGLYYETLFGKVVFLANLSSKFNTLYVLKSPFNYVFEPKMYDLVSGFLKVEMKNNYFIADMVRGHISRAEYLSKERIEDVSMRINDLTFRDTLEYSSNKIFSAYRFVSDDFTYTQVFFANNPGVYKFFDEYESSGSLYTIEEELEIDGYPYFYSDNTKYGQLDYLNSQCYNVTSNHLTFYDNSDGLSLTFSKPVEMSFCGRNNTIFFKTFFNLSGGISYKYAFYKGSYELSKNYLDEPIYRMGVNEVLTGINLNFLKQFNYSESEIKKEWGFPESRDFRLVIYDPIDKNYIFDYSTGEVDGASDVYSKEFNDYLLDAYGNLQRVLITIMTW